MRINSRTQLVGVAMFPLTWQFLTELHIYIYSMTQPFRNQVSAPKKWMHVSTQRLEHECSLQLYSLQLKTGNHPNVHQQNKWRDKWWQSPQWNINSVLKKEKRINYRYTRHDLDKAHEYHTKAKKPRAREHLRDSVYGKYKKRQKQSLLVEVRIVAALWERRG